FTRKNLPLPVTPTRFWVPLWVLTFGTLASLPLVRWCRVRARIGRGLGRRSLSRGRGVRGGRRSVARGRDRRSRLAVRGRARGRLGLGFRGLTLGGGTLGAARTGPAAV